MENTLEALKGAYKTAYEEIGINNPLTREIGGLIVRFSRGQGAQVLEELKRAVNQSRQQTTGKPATSYEVFIHPLQAAKPQAGEQVAQEQENQSQPLSPVAAADEPGQEPAEGPEGPGEPVAPPAPVVPFDIDLSKTTANAIAKEYSKGEIIATLTVKGIKPEPGKSFDEFNPRQLAALLINQGKK